jgi:hypothetical protein
VESNCESMELRATVRFGGTFVHVMTGSSWPELRHIGERRNSIVIDRRKRCSPWKPCAAALGPVMD